VILWVLCTTRPKVQDIYLAKNSLGLVSNKSISIGLLWQVSLSLPSRLTCYQCDGRYFLDAIIVSIFSSIHSLLQFVEEIYVVKNDSVGSQPRTFIPDILLADYAIELLDD